MSRNRLAGTTVMVIVMVTAGGQGSNPIREAFCTVPDSQLITTRRDMHRESANYFSSYDEFRMENRKTSQSRRAGEARS